ncbi:MAG: PDZ domain-containing protein [Acidobacteriota bacterium]
MQRSVPRFEPSTARWLTSALLGVLLAGSIAFVPTSTAWADEPPRVERRVQIIHAQPPQPPNPPTPPHAPAAPCPRIIVNGVEMAGDSRGFLGVEVQKLTPELRTHFGVPSDAGVMIGRLVEDGPAGQAGLAVGDIVSRIDDLEIADAWDLSAAVAGHEGGDEVAVTFWRDGRSETRLVELGATERCGFDVGHLIDLQGLEDLDIDLDIDSLEIEETTRLALEQALGALREIDWKQEMEAVERVHEIEMEKLEVEMQKLEQKMREVEREIESEVRQRTQNVEARARQVEQRIAAEQQRIQIERRQIEREAERRQQEALVHMESERRRLEAKAELQRRAAERRAAELENAER